MSPPERRTITSDEVATNSVAATWRDSLRVERDYFDRLHSRQEHSEWFDPILKLIRRITSTVPTRDDKLDMLDTDMIGEQMRKCFYQYELGAGLKADTEVDAEFTAGVIFSPKVASELEANPSPEMMAVLLSQSIGYDSGEDESIGGQPAQYRIGDIYDHGTNTSHRKKRSVPTYVGQHILRWQREHDPLTRWPMPSFSRHGFFVRGEPITVEFHFRYISLVPGTVTELPKASASRFKEVGSIPALRSRGPPILIQERRHILMMRLFPDREFSRFTIISLGGLLLSETIEVQKREMAGSLTPLVLFIKFLRMLLVAYNAEWYAVLAQIQREVDFSISDLEDDNRIEPLMFDGEDQHVSKAYFKISQLLRIFRSMILETHKDFRDWHFKLLSTFNDDHPVFEMGAEQVVSQKDIAKMCEEWTAWVGRLNGRLKGMQAQVKDIQEDITRLTESLSNATAVRETIESTKQGNESTRLNRYVLVFTIVTIIYLPLTFVTAFFGMNNISNGSPLYTSMKPFAWMLLALSFSTYAIAGASIMFYDGHKERKRRKVDAKTENKNIAKDDEIKSKKIAKDDEIESKKNAKDDQHKTNRRRALMGKKGSCLGSNDSSV